MNEIKAGIDHLVAEEDKLPKVREIRVIAVESKAGRGVLGDPVRWVMDYYEGGKHLFRNDPIGGLERTAAAMTEGVLASKGPYQQHAGMGKSSTPVLDAIMALRHELAKESPAPPHLKIEVEDMTFRRIKCEAMTLSPYRAPAAPFGQSIAEEIEVNGVKVVRR